MLKRRNGRICRHARPMNFICGENNEPDRLSLIPRAEARTPRWPPSHTAYVKKGARAMAEGKIAGRVPGRTMSYSLQLFRRRAAPSLDVLPLGRSLPACTR